jgi:hypothetical protein
MTKLMALAIGVIFLATAAPAQAPVKFTGMNIDFHTGSDDKNPETRLEVFIVPRDGDPAVAYLDVKGQGFPNDSERPLVVNPLGNGFVAAQLHSEKILVKITHQDGTDRNDTWIFNFNAVLHFSDGTSTTFSSPTTALTINGPAHQKLYSLADTPLPK